MSKPKQIFLKNTVLADEERIWTSDLVIEDGVIKKMGEGLDVPEAETVLDGGGVLCACPGLFDMHVHFRDPGLTHKEDLYTGAAAALAGGIAGAACMPNTNPPVDSPETVRYLLDKAKDTGVELCPVGCITQGMAGDRLADFQALKAAGVRAVSDDGRPVRNAELLRQALALSRENGLLVISHCEDMDMIGKGIMHKGSVSRELGVPGMDRASEDSVTAREIALAAAENARIHIAHVSTKGSVALIRDAKRRGVQVTCETAPHYFYYTHEKLRSRDADYRMNPPLREEEDRLAVLEGVLDGTIDCIVTDHAPHTAEEKACFDTAPNGVVGLETSLAAVLTALVHTGKLALSDVVRLMSANPRRLLGLPAWKLEEGAPACLTLFDPTEKWTVDPERLRSKSHNTVFKGETFTGRPLGVIAGGALYRAGWHS